MLCPSIRMGQCDLCIGAGKPRVELNRLYVILSGFGIGVSGKSTKRVLNSLMCQMLVLLHHPSGFCHLSMQDDSQLACMTAT